MSKKDQAHAHRWQNRVHNWLIMPQMGGNTKLRPVTHDELAKHKVSAGGAPGGGNKEMWMAVNGMVYDVTRFTQFHPGGVLLMQKYSGMDASVVYAKNHTNVPPEDVIGNYRIGPLVPNPAPGGSTAPAGAPSTTATSTATSSSVPAPTRSPDPLLTPQRSSNTLGAPATASAVPSSSSLAPPINPATMRFPPSAAAAHKYERQPHKNPSSSPALLEPLDVIVGAARNSRLFDSVPDDELAAAAVASRNDKRAKRDARDPQYAHGAVEGTPSAEVIAEEEADDIASIECVFDLLDAEQKGSIRMDQLEAFLVNIGGFPDAKTAKEAVRDTLNGMPSIKATGRITKAQFVEIANSL